jgi:hypothetical protein
VSADPAIQVDSVDTRTAALATLLTLSRDMLALARAGAWDELVEMEARRGRLLTDFFSTPPITDAAAAIAAAIREILELDREVMNLGIACRDALAAELRGVGTVRAATRAYAENSL